MIRTFDLMNSSGEAYNLTVTDRYTGFLTVADGLGYESGTEYQRIGEEYEPIVDYYNQAVISGVIQFFQPYAYQKFSAFALFCQDKNLTLYYRTPTGLFKRDGSISKIEKSEGNDSLKVKIDFTCRGLWYQDIEESSDTDTVVINNDSMLESPCCIEMTGMTKTNASVTWSQYLSEGATLPFMSGSVSGVTMASTDKLYVRTDIMPYKIYLDSSGTITDLYSKSNFAMQRFLHIQHGYNKFVAMETGAKIKVKGRIYYETV